MRITHAVALLEVGLGRLQGMLANAMEAPAEAGRGDGLIAPFDRIEPLPLGTRVMHARRDGVGMQAGRGQRFDFVAQRAAAALVRPDLPALEFSQSPVQRSKPVLEGRGNLSARPDHVGKFDVRRLRGTRVSCRQCRLVTRHQFFDSFASGGIALFAFAARLLGRCGQCRIEAGARGDNFNNFGSRLRQAAIICFARRPRCHRCDIGGRRCLLRQAEFGRMRIATYVCQLVDQRHGAAKARGQCIGYVVAQLVPVAFDRGARCCVIRARVAQQNLDALAKYAGTRGDRAGIARADAHRLESLARQAADGLVGLARAFGDTLQSGGIVDALQSK